MDIGKTNIEMAQGFRDKYFGPEHRSGQRRERIDRRDLIRFELNKKKRRAAKDRRVVRNLADKSYIMF